MADSNTILKATKRQTPPAPESLDPAEAYVQAELEKQSGAPLFGWKIAATSEAPTIVRFRPTVSAQMARA